jgi:hypothetical protein
MRLPAFAILAFVASGCTIHVVEQPASPALVAAAPQPAPVYAAPAHPVVVVAEPVAPAPVVTPTPTPTPSATPVTMPVPPRRAERPQHLTPLAKPWRVPYRTTVAPEARSPHLARVAGPTKRNVPKKTKLPEPALLASTSVAKAQ